MGGARKLSSLGIEVEQHSLDATVTVVGRETEFREDAADVFGNRRLADDELAGDRLVG